MKTIDALRAYNGPVAAYQSDVKDGKSPNGSSVSNIGQLKETAAKLASVDFHNSDKIINPEERNFFIKMFPDSSAQIERHVLFNRNGRLAPSDISKGMIIDGRI